MQRLGNLLTGVVAVYFSVRARALCSFLSGIVAIISGNILGVSRSTTCLKGPLWPVIVSSRLSNPDVMTRDLTQPQAYLDHTRLSLKTRARGAFYLTQTLQCGWYIWATVLATHFRNTSPTYDWTDSGFGSPFALFLFLVIGFQLNYLYLYVFHIPTQAMFPLTASRYFVIGQIAETPEEVVRLAALLRGTESAWQALSYGLNAVPVFAAVGGFYLNFGLWFLALGPAWLVIRHIGNDGRNAPIWQDKDSDAGKEGGHIGESIVPKHE